MRIVERLEEINNRLRKIKALKKNISSIQEIIEELKELKPDVKPIKSIGSINFAVNALKGVIDGLRDRADRKFLQRQINRAVKKLDDGIKNLRQAKKPKKQYDIFEVPKGKKLTDLPFSYLVELGDKIGRNRVIKKLIEISSNKQDPYSPWASKMLRKFQEMLDWKSLLKDLYSKEQKPEVRPSRRGEKHRREKAYLDYVKSIKTRFLKDDELFGLIEKPVVLIKARITSRGAFKMSSIYDYKVNKISHYTIIENCPLVGLHISLIKRKKSVEPALNEACNWINNERSSSDRLLIASPPLKYKNHYYAIALNFELVRRGDIAIRKWDFVGAGTKEKGGDHK